jgi:hypothetical protein
MPMMQKWLIIFSPVFDCSYVITKKTYTGSFSGKPGVNFLKTKN